MRKKIRDFYKDKGFELTKLYRKRPPGIKQTQVAAAAQELYRQIQKGLEIKDINIPRRIFELAKTIEYKEFEKEQEILEDHKRVIEYYKDRCLTLYIAIGFLLLSLILKLGGFV